jgi:hypothetical protein
MSSLKVYLILFIISVVVPSTNDLEEDNTSILESTLETIDIRTLDRKIILKTDSHSEAPNWSPSATQVAVVSYKVK